MNKPRKIYKAAAEGQPLAIGMKYVGLWLEPDQYEGLKRLADADDRKLAPFLRRIIDTTLANSVNQK